MIYASIKTFLHTQQSIKTPRKPDQTIGKHVAKRQSTYKRTQSISTRGDCQHSEEKKRLNTQDVTYMNAVVRTRQNKRAHFWNTICLSHAQRQMDTVVTRKQ